MLVDDGRKALACLRDNVGMLDAKAEARVVPADALRPATVASLPGGPFALMFADPPYRIEPARMQEVFAALAAGGRLAPGAWAVYEHDARLTVEWSDAFEAADRRVWGSTAVSFATLSQGVPNQ